MTREEKLSQVEALLNQTGNTTKIVRYLIMQALHSLDEAKVDEILAVLNNE